MDRIFKIKFNVSDEDLEEIFLYFSDDDLDEIEELEAESFFDYHEDGKYVCFLITPASAMRTYVEVMHRNQVNIKVKDFSDKISESKIDLEEELRGEITADNCQDFEFFMTCVNEWILNQLDMDSVLDRISSVGIENLSKIEKHFLETYTV